MSRTKVICSWSGGKDSAVALWELLQSPSHDVVGLLTTVTDDYQRISMHGVREDLLEAQARCVGIPLHLIRISKNASEQEYASTMKAFLLEQKAKGVVHVSFGDLFLQNVRHYREANLRQVGMNGLFPLWGRETDALVHSFVKQGFKAIVTCVDTQQLDRGFAGRVIDESFLSDLPPNVDPCGENGEFHSFVFEGPLFQESVAFQKGEVVLKDDRFCFCDLVPIHAV